MPERLRLKPRAALEDYQEYVRGAMERNGQPLDTISTQLLLVEELGRLSKAIRADVGLAIDPDSKITQKDEALAGLFFFTVYLADRLGIDLETAK